MTPNYPLQYVDDIHAEDLREENWTLDELTPIDSEAKIIDFLLGLSTTALLQLPYYLNLEHEAMAI